MLVQELMTSPAKSLLAGSRLEAAVQMLATHHISAVPIVDANAHVLGIISEADVLNEHIVPDPRAHLRPVEESMQPWHQLVDDVMTPDPMTVQENGDVSWVADLFADTGWKSLPVVRDQRLVGVISRSDIVRALATPDTEVEVRITDDFTQLGHTDWHVNVANGVVTVRGATQGQEARLDRTIAETAPGVRRVIVEQPLEPVPGARRAEDVSLLLKNLHRRF